jgi:hypothetical protein
VACALEIQRDFHAKNLELSKTWQLQPLAAGSPTISVR